MNTLRDNDNELFKFLNTSTSPYHAVQNVREYLLEADFTQLDEQTPWELSAGGYFIAVSYTHLTLPTNREV